MAILDAVVFLIRVVRYFHGILVAFDLNYIAYGIVAGLLQGKHVICSFRGYLFSLA